MALWKNGDDTWTKVVEFNGGIGQKVYKDSFSDVVYFKAEFYAVNQSGQVVVISFDPDRPEVARATLLVDLQKLNYLPKVIDRLYIVVLRDKLLVVLRVFYDNYEMEEDLGEDWEDDELEVDSSKDLGEDSDDKEFYITKRFALFGLNHLDKEDVGDESLFLGDNQSISIKVSDCPGLKPYCIYFTDDGYELWRRDKGAGNDMGIYNMEDGTIELYYRVTDSLRNKFSPVWV